MKRLVFFLSILFIFSLGCKNKQAKDKTEQTTGSQPTAYVNTDYNFSVEFPSKPQVQVSKINTEKGEIHNITFANEQEKIAYIVLVSVYPENFAQQAEPTSSVKTQVTQIAKNFGLNQVKGEENNLEHPSFYFEGEGSNVYGILQGIGVQNKIYVVAAIAEGTNAKDMVLDKGKKFISSFKLLK